MWMESLSVMVFKTQTVYMYFKIAHNNVSYVETKKEGKRKYF